MSEYINNSVARQAILKDIIRQLHEGKGVDDVKREFAALLGDVGATEIADIEQALIAEGLPETEVKRLCDVHVGVFRESLDRQEKPEAAQGHPLQIYKMENEAVLSILDVLQKAIERLRSGGGVDALDDARRLVSELREYEKHYSRKENVLFPYLEQHGFTGPSAVMWAIHDDVRAGWKSLDAVLATEPSGSSTSLGLRAMTIFEPLDKMIREMIYKEENILFPAALEKLSQDEWAAVRNQGPEIGYAYVKPGVDGGPSEDVSEPIASSEGVAARVAAEDALELETGALTAEEVNLLLTHLPVDVTYVGEDDRVRYFSQTKDRIFQRSPAIIGREVQKCHPPASVHRVQRILDDFRAGRRDAAEFWLQLGGKFIHIRYYALRDEDSEYRGTLEVSQDVSGVRALEGERRLIEDSE